MNSKTVYVLGAGFSQQAGCPLVNDFLNDRIISGLKHKIKNKKELSKLNSLCEYMENRIQMGYCKPNIEDIFNHVSAARFLFMESTLEQKRRSYSAQNIYNDLQWFIIRILKENTKKDIPQEYYDFLEKICKKNDTIITFNYDLILETILEDLKIPYQYGISEKLESNRRLILKLHGSSNLSYCLECTHIHLSDGYSVIDVLNKKSRCHKCNSKQVEPLLIPPTLHKDYQVGEQQGLFRWLWSRANEELSLAKNIVFVGFSMTETDSMAHELFKLSSNMNQQDEKYFVISRSNKLELKNRYKETLVKKKIKFEKKTTLDFIKSGTKIIP